MSILNKEISLTLTLHIIQLSVPFDDKTLTNVRKYIPWQPWLNADNAFITLRLAIDIFENSIANTGDLETKRRRFAGHLCGHGFGHYDDVLILLSTWLVHTND
jgi:hypothetical protein